LTAKPRPEVAGAMTDEARAEFVGLLVSDVTITADDLVSMTGTLGCSIE